MHSTDVTEPRAPTFGAGMLPASSGAAALAAAALLTACGGGAEPPDAMRSGQAAKVMPGLLGADGSGSRSARMAAARAPTPDELMDWAERQFPGFFPSHETSHTSGELIFRFYPGTATYLGVLNGDVLALGPVTGGQVAALGRLADFADLVFAGGGGGVDSDEAAARFLHHATFGATDADIAAVRQQGYAGWLDAQMAQPRGQRSWDWMQAHGYATVDDVDVGEAPDGVGRQCVQDGEGGQRGEGEAAQGAAGGVHESSWKRG